MSESRITKCEAREINDSRGRPTLEIFLAAGEFSTSARVPSGKSTGSREAKELRDADGIGLKKTLEIFEQEIIPAVVGQSVVSEKIDAVLLALDGTKDKSRLGGNSIIGLSFATERLEAKIKEVPLWKHISEKMDIEPSFPKLFMNMINGGAHANFRLPFQEYIVVIDGKDQRRAYESGLEIFDCLGESIRSEFGEVPMGDEGGYSPRIDSLEKPFTLLSEVASGENTFLAIDAAASEFFKDGSYNILNNSLSAEELLSLYSDLVKKYPLRSIEDPFAEDSMSDFASLVKNEGSNILVVGDDLTVTNPDDIRKVAESGAANAVIIKPNQVGSLTETYEALRLARSAGWQTIVSHRSGETEDDFIADLAVGIGAYGIKAGAPIPAERRVKYSRLIAIQETEYK